MKYRVIQEHDRRYPIRLMCRTLAVSPAGYHAWRGRPESRRAATNRTLLVTIRVLHQESRQTYGIPSIWQALRAQGHRVGEHRVARTASVLNSSVYCRLVLVLILSSDFIPFLLIQVSVKSGEGHHVTAQNILAEILIFLLFMLIEDKDLSCLDNKRVSPSLMVPCGDRGSDNHYPTPTKGAANRNLDHEIDGKV